MTPRLLVVLVFAVLCASTMVAADTLYVSASIPASGGGQSWQAPFKTIEEALTSWHEGDEIWVARGAYQPSAQGLTLSNGMRIYGGFKGDELRREERDWYRRKTIIAGNATTPRLVTLTNCDSSTRVDGFAFHGASSSAIYVSQGCPRIVNCSFVDNRGAIGSAILAEGATRIHIEYCVFEYNKSNDNGGAVAIRNSGADPYGYGAFIAQCFFIDNESTLGSGGAITIEGSSTIPQIVSCVFANNKATEAGAIASYSAYVYVLNSTFYKNNATNTSDSTAYTLLLNGGELLNNVVWNGDLPSTYVHVKRLGSGTPEDTTVLRPTANLVEADFTYGFWQANPSFEDETLLPGADGFYGTDDDGLRLSSFSIARDGGFVDKYVNSRQTDVIGNPRLVGRKIDLGAYESQRKNHLTPPEMVAEMLKGGYSFFYRHSKTDWDQKDKGPAPECFPGRNLIYEGREMMREVGKMQRLLEIPIGEVASSPVCRCWETADLMCGRYEVVAYWGSGGSASVGATRDSALKIVALGANRVITSHDAVANAVFNPSADGTVMTTAELMEGDNLFVKALGDTFEVVGHWCADTWERYRVRFPDPSSSVISESIVKGALACYPNPAGSTLTIQSESADAIRILNVLGVTLWDNVVSGSVTLNVSDWPVGTYFVATTTSVLPVTVLR